MRDRSDSCGLSAPSASGILAQGARDDLRVSRIGNSITSSCSAGPRRSSLLTTPHVQVWPRSSALAAKALCYLCTALAGCDRVRRYAPVQSESTRRHSSRPPPHRHVRRRAAARRDRGGPNFRLARVARDADAARLCVARRRRRRAQADDGDEVPPTRTWRTRCAASPTAPRYRSIVGRDADQRAVRRSCPTGHCSATPVAAETAATSTPSTAPAMRRGPQGGLARPVHDFTTTWRRTGTGEPNSPGSCAGLIYPGALAG